MTSLKDSDNIARLEALRPRWERLRDQKIRADADVERREEDLKRAVDAAIEAAGTDDEDEIRKIILRSYELNTAAVDAFEAAVIAAETALEQAEADRQQGA